MTADFEYSGRLWCRNALGADNLARLDRLCDLAGRPGARVGPSAALDAALSEESLTQVISRFLPGAKPVRVVSFDKSSTNNWAVPWHQDRVIAVKERHPVAGFKNWSLKAGIWHCEPPVEVLNKMLFVRIHLDDCDAESGAMQIALNSHSYGAVTSAEAAGIAERSGLKPAWRGGATF